jgi:hypothetical protein
MPKFPASAAMVDTPNSLPASGEDSASRARGIETNVILKDKHFSTVDSGQRNFTFCRSMLGICRPTFGGP